MGKIDKGILCSVPGCKETAFRCISGVKAERSGLGIEKARHVYLCKGHYKEFKRKNREERRIEKWRWSE
ncbi:MAG: hypothetical protein QXI32_05440 [Candidatus Bathyarchaeia archaeon]